jgi:hypothetical protein
MLTKKLVAAAVAALGLSALPAAAAIEYTVVELGTAPPAMQSEVIPPAREGYTWIPGYWDYRDSQYSWVGGHYETAREGYVYVAPRYEQADGRWRMYAGGWDRRGDAEEHGGARNRVANKIEHRSADEEHGGVRNRIADKIRGKDDD